MREDRLVGAFIDNVDGQTVAGLHQSVQVFASMVHLDPARMITGGRSLQTVDQSQLTGLRILLVCPDLVGLQVRGVQVGLGGVEHHTVDARVLLVLVVLNIGIQRAVGFHGEDIAEPSVLVEGVAVHVVGRLVGREHEDGAGVGFTAGGQG